MKIFVTGGLGFIGRALIQRLTEDGHTVTAGIRDITKNSLIFPPNLNVIKFNEDIDFLEINAKENFDCIMHLATYYSLDETYISVDKMIRSNYNLTLNLLLGAVHKNTPVIMAGSFTQTASINKGPVSVYSLTKEAASAAASFFAINHHIKIIELRIFDTYGPGDSRRKFLDLLIDASLSGKELKASPGEQKIDLVNVSDVVEGFACALELLESLSPGEQHKFEIASRNPMSLKQLAKLVGSITQRNLQVAWGSFPYRKYEMFDYSPENPLLPNWHPRIDLESGVRDLIKRKDRNFNE